MRSTNSIRIFKYIFHPLPYCVTGDDGLIINAQSPADTVSYLGGGSVSLR